MSDDPLYDRLRATRLLLESQLAARPEVDDDRLGRLLDASGPELRLVVALLSTLDIAPGLLPDAAGAGEGAPGGEADAALAQALGTGAPPPPVAPLAPAELDRLLPRLEQLVETLRRGAP